MAHIKTFEGTYCFISICGDYRSGKSFLLNSLFFNYSGFETSSTTTSCTKGIKIWSVPIERNGIYIWIIDTEGFGSIEKDSTYDGKIFLMNFLISNIVLYNSFGAID
jgi:septin family protein